MCNIRYLLFFGLLFVTGCGPLTRFDPVIIPDNTPNLRALSVGEVNISLANNDFAFNLFRDIQRQSAGSNVFISPLSISMALGMAVNGAGDSTQISILKTIHFGNLTPAEVNQAYKDLTGLLTTMDRTVEISLANSIWFNKQYSVKSSFSDAMKGYYDATVQGLDFSDADSPQVINAWVDGKTNHKITNLISSISADQVMFLINAIYFKGDWAKQFDASQTQKKVFTSEDNTTQQVDMMFVNDAPIHDLHHNKFLLADLPYGNAQFSMTILLPDPGTSVQQITKSLTADSLDLWLSQANVGSANVWLPKFKIDWKNDLKRNLEDLGMTMTGFPNLFDQPLPLEITKVVHQSSIDVNEAGSTAAAATGVALGVTSIGPTITIEINRPFVYFIREKHSGVILFMGQLYVP